MGGLKNLIVTLCLAWQICSALGKTPCYDEIRSACAQEDGLTGLDSKMCTAEWGAFPRLTNDTNTLISVHLTQSMQYLLQASHFNEWNVNRPGLHAFFSKLSDEEWDSATALMIHMIKRGGRLVETHFKVDIQKSWENRQNELEALSWALDIEKAAATRILHLAHAAVNAPKDTPDVPRDAEFADFLAERLNHQTVLRIKHLSNYVNMLAQSLKRSEVDNAYALFTFDHEIIK